MSSQHTPGPWTVEDVNSAHLHDVCLAYPVTGAGNPILLASVFWDEDHHGPITLSQANANARLIAAAPELLEACRKALENLEEVPGREEQWACAELRAAIAKTIGPE